VRVHVVERQLRRDDARGAQAHVGVHGAQLPQVVRRVRQQARAGFAPRRQRRELGVGGFAAARVRRAADEAGEVVEVELARHQPTSPLKRS